VERARADRARLIDHLTLLLIWCVAVVLVDPRGDFPLNDDWVYGKAVQTFIEHGILRLPGYAAAPIVSQVIWGALFCKIFGFSFTVLRASTLASASIGTAVLYEILSFCRLPRRLALAGALTLLLNPVFFALSFSFMTDVPFLVFGLCGIWFILRTLDGGGKRSLAAALFFISAATLCRQVGLALALAFAAAYITRYGLRRRTLLDAALIVFVPIAALAGFEAILKATTGLPRYYLSKEAELWEQFRTRNWLELFFSPRQNTGSLLRRGFTALIYVGLFLVPVSAGLMPKESRPKATFMRWAVICLIAGLGSLGLLSAKRAMPILGDGGNILINWGLGPQSLRDAELDLPNVPAAPAAFWLAVTALSSLGACLLALLSLEPLKALFARRDRFKDAVLVFSAVGAMTYFVPMGIAGFYDRYLLLLLPLTILFIGAGSRAPLGAARPCMTYGCLIGFGLYAVAGTHDYLAWNRCRWNALRLLTERMGVPPERIDGGKEFNGWYMYDDAYRPLKAKSSYWVQDDEYVISFRVLAGYRPISELSFDRWLPPGKGEIYVLRRCNAVPDT